MVILHSFMNRIRYRCLSHLEYVKIMAQCIFPYASELKGLNACFAHETCSLHDFGHIIFLYRSPYIKKQVKNLKNNILQNQ